MTEALTSTIIHTAIWIFFILVYVSVLVRLGLNYFGKKVGRQATVIDKYMTQYKPVGSRLTPQTKVQYILTFTCGQRTLKFKVSPWVYDTVEKNDKGILTYRGTHFISFENT